MIYSPKSRESGFTLVELLIAMLISLILLSAISAAFISQRRSYDVQEQISEMVQNARAAMDMIGREARMAGYDPSGAMQKTNPAYTDFVGIPYNTSQLELIADINGDGAIDTTSEEDITYSYDSANLQIDRNIGAGNQPFAENIQAFSFAYLDSSGNPTATTGNIRQIRITITARTSKPDPNYSANGGYRTYELVSLITPQNLAY